MKFYDESLYAVFESMTTELQTVIHVFNDDVSLIEGQIEQLLFDDERLYVRGIKKNNTTGNELLLHFEEETLTVKLVTFANTRQGFLTKLIDALTQFGQVEQYKQLKIEAISSTEMLNFVQKNDFINEPSTAPTGYKEIFPSNDWYKEIPTRPI